MSPRTQRPQPAHGKNTPPDLISAAQAVADSVKMFNEVATQWLRDNERALTAAKAASFYVDLYRSQQHIDKQLKVTSEIAREIKDHRIPKLFEEEELKSFTLDSGHRVTVASLMRAQVVDKPKAIAWLKKNKLGSIISVEPSINPSTLGAALRTLLDDKGVVPPEDVIKTVHLPSTSVTLAK